MSRTSNIVLALLLTALSAVGCKPDNSAEPGDSRINSLEHAMAIGRVSAKANEVMVYYANETRPDESERANLDYILGLMRKSKKPLILDSAKKIEADARDFASAVDQDVVELEAGICANTANKTLHLVVFDNKTGRDGKYRFCMGGSGALKIEESTAFAEALAAEPFKSDARYRSNPMASKVILGAALQLVRDRFHPARHAFTLITKSHGSPERAVGIRMAIQGDVIKSEANGEARFLAAIDDLADKREASLTAAINLRRQMQTRLIAALQALPASYALKDALLKDALLKDALLKDALLKDALLKDAILKDALLKDALLKDAILKDAILKDAILKDAILKDALLKDALLKDAILKDALLKDALLADEQPSAQAAGGDILAKATGAGVGITKRDWLGEIAKMDDEAPEKRMEFHVVFAESCESYLSWDILMDLGESEWNPNIGVLFTSDVKGLESYRTVDYKQYFTTHKWDGKFAAQFTAFLNLLADQQQASY